MRCAAVVLVLGCASCRAVFGLEPPTHDFGDDASIADTATTDQTIDAQLIACRPDINLVACFEFEGNAMDLAPSPNSISASNVAYASNGVSGQALAVDTASRLTIADSLLLDIPAVTIEAWIRLSEPPPAFGRVGVFDVNGQYALFVNYGRIVSCTAGATFDVGVVPLDQWTHVACTASNGKAAGYINGSPTTEVAYGGALPTSSTDGGEIGGDSPGPGDRLVGRIDVLRVYRVARSAQDICIDAGDPGCL
jgi:hypothetical protein